MKELKLPVIKDYNAPADPVLSLEEYIRFCEFNAKNTLDKKAYWKQKKIMAVDVPFSLK